ncbi:MAG: S8 family serine peptidase [Bacillota bacterium]
MHSQTAPRFRLLLACLAVLLAVTLCVGGASVNASILTSSSTVTGDAWALIHHSENGAVDPSTGLTVEENYGSFSLVHGTPEQLQRAEDVGQAVQMLADRTRVYLNNWSFCTEESEPPVPPDLRSQPASGESAYYLLQFIGPVRDAWIEAAQNEGVRFLEYIPNYTFAVRATEEQMALVSEHPEVQWYGLHHEGMRMSPAVRQALTAGQGDSTGEQKYVVEFYANEFPERFETLLKAAGLVSDEITQLAGYPDSAPRYRAVVEAPLAALFSIITDTGFSYVAPAPSMQLFNAEARAVMNTDQAHSHQLSGSGQTVAITDSGLYTNHEMFVDEDYSGGTGGGLPFPWPLEETGLLPEAAAPDDGPSMPFPWPWDSADSSYGPDHRKVDAFIDLSSDIFSISRDPIGHGTHVAGTIAGDAEPYKEWNKHDGHAYDARLVVVKAFTSMGTWGAGFDFYSVFEEAHNAGARINNQSWGGKSSTLDDGYGTVGRDADRFMADYPSNLLVIASGNFGDDTGNTIATPGDAKNVLTVGAADTDNPEGVASFSSRGPTADNRLKPDLVAPGNPIISAEVDTTDGYIAHQGTSMATPTAAGAATLVRQYYTDGFFPDGAAGGEGLEPSAALVKATLLAGAREVSGSNSDRENEGRYPNCSQGWGLLNLEGSLYWPGDARSMKAWDNPTQLNTGDGWEEEILIGDGSQPLHLHLVWTDPAPAQGSQRHLVNDLNLELVAPDGSVYRGNNLTGINPGYSISGGEADSVNNNEGIRLLPGHSTPGDLPEGQYTVRVVGGNIPQGPQPFALVVRGGLTDEWTPEPPDEEEEPEEEEEEDNVVVTITMNVDAWDDLRDEIMAYDQVEGVEVEVTLPRQ